ncbi:hypothetical protein [Cryobacterium sp. Y57]|uniref:hypothetical protein n=1 Tax=Cryobacterium sp. Y57 TaxID=2048287 RepID=UPI000CE3E2DC|nr:hypothetical protein [Cryobacterium sp. Y57]
MTADVSSFDQLDGVVRGVPGVAALYPAGSMVATVLAATLDAVAQGATAAPLVHIEQRADGIRVTARIGIGAAESSSDVSGRVHDAIAAHLEQSGSPPVVQIVVIVASVWLNV